MDATSKDCIEKIRLWLSTTCKVHATIAAQLAQELVTISGVTDIDQFQILREADPKWLDALDCKLSSITKILINSCVEKIGRTPLQTLSVEEVAMVVASCFSDFPYSQLFKENMINGFNLLYVEDLPTLMKFGINHVVHASTLMASIKEWRRVGVPASYLCLTDEEQSRRIMSIKQEGAASHSSSSSNLLARAAPLASAPVPPPESASEPLPASILPPTLEQGAAPPVTLPAQAPQSHSTDDNTICSEDPSIISAPCRPGADAPGHSSENPFVLDTSSAESAHTPTGSSSGSSSVSSGSGDGDSVSDSWSDIFEEEDKQTTPGRIGALRSSAERRKRGRIELDFDEEEEDEEGDWDSGNESEYVPRRSSLRAHPTAGPSSQGKKTRRHYRRSDPTVLPSHALLSNGLLAQLSSTSSAFSAPSAQEDPQRSESESGAASSDAAPINPNTGAWEYRTGRSPEGKDLRLLVFVPNTDIPGHSQQRDFRVANLAAPMEVPEQEAERDPQPKLVSSRKSRKGLEEVAQEGLSPQKALTGTEDAGSDDGLKYGQHGAVQLKLDVPTAALPSQLSNTSSNGGANASPAAVEAAEEAYLTMEMDVTLGEVSSHPGVDLDASDLLHEEVRGYESSDSRGRSWEDFGADEEHDLVEFTADGSFPEVIPAPSGESSGSSTDQAIDLVTEGYHKNGQESSGSSQHFNATRRSPNLDPTRPRRNVVSPSSSSAAPRAGSQRSGRRSAGRELSDEPVPSTLPASKKNSYQRLCAECKVVQNSNDEKELTHALNVIRTSVAKPNRAFLEHVLNSGTYVKLLGFVRNESTLSVKLIYHVLRTISFIITGLESFTEIHIIFQRRRFHDILQACQSRDEFVRQQALHVVSELGVNQENDLKQSVLSAGAISAVAKCFSSADVFPHASMVLVRSYCCKTLFNLASTCTPEQYVHFVDALPILRSVLNTEHIPRTDLCKVLQALSHLVQVAPETSKGIDAFFSKEFGFFDSAVSLLHSAEEKTEVRWNACTLVWLVAKHSGPGHVRNLLKLTGVLGQVYLDDYADPDVRAGALNTLQVLLQRGEVFVEQFVHHRDALASNVMEHVRTYAHEELVHGNANTANCIMKYASFTLANAVIYGNKEQLMQLLDMGVYPLLFKIAALDGEDDKPEEAKLRAAHALHRLLQVCPDVLKAHQERAARRRFDVQASWNVVKNLIHEAVLASSGEAKVPDPRSTEPDEGGEEDGWELRWSRELRVCVSEIVAIAERIGLT